MRKGLYPIGFTATFLFFRQQTVGPIRVRNGGCRRRGFNRLFKYGGFVLSNVLEKDCIYCGSFLYVCSRYTGRDSPCILFAVPDGHTKPSPTGGAKTKVSTVATGRVVLRDFLQ